MRRKLALFFFAPFNLGSPKRRAVAGSLGFLLACLPLKVWIGWVLLAAAFILRLNLAALIAGMCVYLLVPFTEWVVLKLNPDAVSVFNNKGWMLAGEALFAALLFPLFLWLYRDRGAEEDRQEGKAFVFQDNGRRWRFIKRVLAVTVICCLLGMIVFADSLVTVAAVPPVAAATEAGPPITPVLQPLPSTDSAHSGHDQKPKSTGEARIKAVPHRGNQPKVERSKISHKVTQPKHVPKETHSNAPQPKPGSKGVHSKPPHGKAVHSMMAVEPVAYTTVRSSPAKLTSYAFYVPWDLRSWVELKEYGYINKLDVLIPQWYSLGSEFSLEEERQPDVDKLAKEHKVAILPSVNNVSDGKWDGDLLHQLFTSPDARSRVIGELLDAVKRNGYDGINLDFEGVHPEDQKGLVAFVTELANEFHRQGYKVTETVPANNRAYDYAALAKVVDRVIVMMFDQHFPEQSHGPLASLDWVKTNLNQLSSIPKDKLVVSLGNYGYDWTVGSSRPATLLTFDEIMQMASEHHLRVFWDKGSQTPYLRYKKGNEEHVVWFLDGATFYNQLNVLALSGVKGVALWRLGSEDVSVWHVFGKDGDPRRIGDAETIGSDIPLYTGEGEILRLVSQPHLGERKFTFDRNKMITDENYVRFPSALEIQSIGQSTAKKVALTFDDGPDPVYTPQILDILDRYHVKASFFVVGQNAVRNPDLIKRMVESGHIVGNHTYTHPMTANLSPNMARLEINATQRLFQALTGRSLTLFRPPYQAGNLPDNKGDVNVLKLSHQMGYTTVGEEVDAEDWHYLVAVILFHNVMNQLPNGHIILMHDAGGNRSATVQVLPKLIETLRSQGYEFVTVDQLMGKTRDQVMPAVNPRELPFVQVGAAMFTAEKIILDGFEALMFAAIGVGLVRTLLLGYFSYRQKKRRKKPEDGAFSDAASAYRPLVSVVIPAYNEEKVINRTIRSVLNSDYRPLEVIIVNDGSKDRTEEVILEEFADHPDVRVISKPNSGKTDSINLGYREAAGEIIVSIDADTIIAQDAISLMVRHFADEKVAAVSGNVKVGNVRNLLTTWQHVEYITGFNLERRAFDELNSIPVVPGAIGAWRKSAVAEAGYYQHDTLAEDTDITLMLLRKGYRVCYEEHAYAYTEAPEDVRSFIKQRTRWIYGTLQCLWKHRGALFSGKQKSLGYVTLPNMWAFQYGVQLLSPFTDLLFILSLFTVYATKTLLFYLAFLVLDMAAAFYAFSLEKESPKPLIWLFLQRFVYRQFMTYVVFKSIYFALKGVTVGWNKLQRKGNVTMEAATSAG
jgi:cellulose synthase/poly-beta-1,6-N-acetylglucosamine synthase-like glycosyltransferase/peptidoglycan/xylan/chitin deacetylase (PgdA/CDA1 family)